MVSACSSEICTYLVLHCLCAFSSRWRLRENINPICLTFENIQWELPFLKQPDPLFKFYVGCALLVLLGMMVIQCLGLPRYSLQELKANLYFIILICSYLLWVLNVREQVSIRDSWTINFMALLYFMNEQLLSFLSYSQDMFNNTAYICYRYQFNVIYSYA
jgi:hypothetical protein